MCIPSNDVINIQIAIDRKRVSDPCNLMCLQDCIIQVVDPQGKLPKNPIIFAFQNLKEIENYPILGDSSNLQKFCQSHLQKIFFVDTFAFSPMVTRVIICSCFLLFNFFAINKIFIKVFILLFPILLLFYHKYKFFNAF